DAGGARAIWALPAPDRALSRATGRPNPAGTPQREAVSRGSPTATARHSHPYSISRVASVGAVGIGRNPSGCASIGRIPVTKRLPRQPARTERTHSIFKFFHAREPRIHDVHSRVEQLENSRARRRGSPPCVDSLCFDRVEPRQGVRGPASGPGGRVLRTS